MIAATPAATSPPGSRPTIQRTLPLARPSPPRTAPHAITPLLGQPPRSITAPRAGLSPGFTPPRPARTATPTTITISPPPTPIATVAIRINTTAPQPWAAPFPITSLLDFPRRSALRATPPRIGPPPGVTIPRDSLCRTCTRMPRPARSTPAPTATSPTITICRLPRRLAALLDAISLPGNKPIIRRTQRLARRSLLRNVPHATPPPAGAPPISITALPASL